MKSYIHLYKTNSEFTKAYNGPDYVEPWLSLTEENMTIGYSKPKLTAITFDSITWVTDIPATGGTATKGNCEFKVYGKYNNGISVDISSDAVVTGELVVPSSTEGQRHEIEQPLILTASYSGFTATGNVTVYQAADFSMEPLTFNVLSAGTINWTASDSSASKTIEYNLNNGDKWVSIASNTGSLTPTIEVNPGDKIQFRGDNTAYCGDNPDLCSTFGGSTARFEVEGNIMSLINPTDFSTLITLKSGFTFANLFSDCTGLTSAENLILPATTLAIGCYFTMFQGCKSLTTAPKLPATKLAMGCYVSMFQGCTSLTTAPTLPVTSLETVCYQYMFQGCSSLTSAPELPATALTEACYVSMFNGCTRLTTAPALPATTLATSCYQSMFQNCTSLTKAPALPATTLANDCYKYMFNGCTSLTTAPSILPANTLAGYCYNGMFKGCTSLATAPELPATTLADNCYLDMFYGCTSLTTAPELPATTLAEFCYNGMFAGCTNLNYIKCLATDVSATDCTWSWVSGVASTGTFVKAASMTGWTTGNSGIPSGWAVEDNQEPLTFNILSAGTINWTASNTDITKTIDYKLNNGEWTSITSNTGSSAPTITVNSGDKIQFRGNNSQYATSSYYNSFSGSTASFEVEGNIMSLIYGDDFKNNLTISRTYAFLGLFRDCAKLVSAKNLVLPATTLASYCYQSMFSNCTSLTAVPQLPATNLAMYCYYAMFNGCTSLTTAPKLPATTLKIGCYQSMFNGCTSLTTAPELPATTLETSCYEYMFSGCTSLTTAPELPATTLAQMCYSGMFQGCTSLTTAPSVLPATTLKDSCYRYMFDGCTSLTEVPQLPVTTLAEDCCRYMFQGCTSLTTAPELPATTLARNCYYYMFNGCTSLNYIKCLATDISASNCTKNWVNGVAATGTFVKNPDMASWPTGVNGIPTGWAVEEYIDYNKKPLTFKITSGGTIYWSTSNRSVSKTIEYKLNDGEWKTITSNTWTSAPKFNVNAGDKVQFKGNNTAYGAYSSRDALYNTFYGSTARFEIEGNIMSLINSTDFATLTTLESDYTFSYLFDNCTGLTSAENLILPATTLTSECYQYMFQNCRSLTTAPKLPATKLAYDCYYYMFAGCASLTTAPKLPAKTLEGSCYHSMFYGCASLTTAPKLPAKTLERYCYTQMFYNCVSLTVAPELPAAILEYGCYQYMFENCRSLNYIKCLATDISARNCRERWVSGVASTGTFVKNPSVTWPTGENGIPKNWKVQDA